MEFQTGTGTQFTDPTASQLADELAGLPGGIDSFAILSRDELTYIQTAGGGTEGFVLEYQEGSIEHHYRSVSSDLPIGTVTEAFQLYSTADPSWKHLTEWQHDDLTQYSQGIPLLPVALVLAVIVVAVAWWCERSG